MQIVQFIIDLFIVYYASACIFLHRTSSLVLFPPYDTDHDDRLSD